MRLRLAYKLFLTFFITSVISVIFMLGIMRYSFERDFRAFINKSEIERLGKVVQKLGEAYQVQNSWDFLLTDEEAFREILDSFFSADILSPGAGQRTALPAPPSFPFGRQPAPDVQAGPRPPYHPGPHPPSFVDERISIFDDQKRVIAGQAGSTEGHLLKPIIVNEHIVGWLGLKIRSAFTDPLEQWFRKRLGFTFVIIGVVVLFLSALVSYFFSRHILKPVAQLTAGAHELASRRFNARIEVRTADELGQLAFDFNRMAQTLGQYEQLRQQWISDISHELRTPLAILLGEVEALQDGVRPLSMSNLESLHAEVLHLEKLVDDLHVLSLADSGALAINLTRVDILKILKESIAHFVPRLKQADIRLDCDLSTAPEIKVMADERRLAQVFDNLIENTLRYTEAPGRLRIYWQYGGRNLHLIFEDSAPGVPENALEKVFDRLYRVDKSRSRSLGGSGLGLAITKDLIESFGGTIQAGHSALGGLRIEMILPKTDMT